MPTSTTAASSPASTRPAAVGDAAVSESISACSSTSRAVITPEAGTSTSRRPAARKSGTSEPRARRTSDGTPSSSSIPWIISASAWLDAPITRTRSPSLSWGLILRTRRRSSSPSQGSSGSVISPHVQIDLADLAVLDEVGAHDRVRALGEADDDPLHARPAAGEVHVRLRRVGLRPCVRVVDRTELRAAVLDLVEHSEQRRTVDLEAKGARREVLGRMDARRLAVAR